MTIPIPYKLSEMGICNGKILTFYGVSWLTKSHQYTYFFKKDRNLVNLMPWDSGVKDFYVSDGTGCKEQLQIDDSLLENKPLHEHGYPLAGSGYIYGITLESGDIYASVILTDRYFARLWIQCNENGKYVPDGKIIFPRTPIFDTKQKKIEFLRTEYGHLADTERGAL